MKNSTTDLDPRFDWTFSIEGFDRARPVQSNGTWGRGGWVTFAEGIETREEAEALLPTFPEFARIAAIGRRKS